jgi:hypothetical protein
MCGERGVTRGHAPGSIRYAARYCVEVKCAIRQLGVTFPGTTQAPVEGWVMAQMPRFPQCRRGWLDRAGGIGPAGSISGAAEPQELWGHQIGNYRL